MVRILYVVAAALVGIWSSFVPLHAQAPDSTSIPAAVTAATNRRDVEGLLSLFTEGGVYRPPTGEQLIGTPVVRIWLETELSSNPYDVIIGTPDVTPGRAVWVRDHVDDFARSLGVTPIRETVEALLEGSRIQALIVRRSAESEARFQAAQGVLSVVRAFEAAQNAGAVDEAVELFADDAVGITADGTRWVGKEQIRTAVQHSWASGAFVERSRYQVVGDHVTSQANVSSDLLRAIGVGAVQVSAEAVVRDGRIQTTTSTLSPESAARLQAAQNRATAARLTQAINDRDLDRLVELFSPDLVNRTAEPGEDPGVDGARAYFSALLAGSADLTATIDEGVAERDLLVVRMTLAGTHTGDLWGIEATGRPFAAAGLEIWRIQTGRIIERWGYPAGADLRTQLTR